MKRFYLNVISLFIALSALNAQNSIPLEEVESYFKQVEAICKKDNGKLWGVQIYAPTLFINPQTLDVVSNAPDNEGLLTKTGNLYTGKFPKNKNIANSTTDYGGKHFTMVMYPLPEDEYERNALIIHEMFHFHQPALNMSGLPYNNNHADEHIARLYFKLEWDALEKAVYETDTAKHKEHIKNALTFRAYRQSQYKDSEVNEAFFELHEGLPEYTAHKLCSTSDDMLKQRLSQIKSRYEQSPSYVRSFAYFSGCAYAYLLDRTNTDWRKRVQSKEHLNKILQTAYKIEIPANIQETVEKIRDAYGFAAINTYELKRKEEKDKVTAYYKSVFTEKPILVLKLIKPSVNFNPNNVISLGDLGTVYPNSFRAINQWGIISVNDGGCLLANNWMKLTVPAENMTIENNIVKTNGWTLELKDGYIVKEDGNNYILKRNETDIHLP
jgi:hypothetical protein